MKNVFKFLVISLFLITAVSLHSTIECSADQVKVDSAKAAFLANQNEWKAFELHRDDNSFNVSKLGDSITVSIDFTYDQVKLKYQREVIRIGASNGSSELMAIFDRKGYGDYHAIGRVGYKVGEVFTTEAIGFATNASVGTSDPLRLTVTLTKESDQKFQMVVLLKNLKPGSNFEKRWQQDGLKFESGSTDELHGVIQNGDSDQLAGIANRNVTRFAVTNDAAAPAPEQDFNGVEFADYILPMQPRGELATKGVWGDPQVLPRDQNNGLEDRNLKEWCYWDGMIVLDDLGRYHMYASRWGQEFSHSEGWRQHSRGTHAVSDHVLGPYEDKGLLWPDHEDGLGHNVIGLRMLDGRYATVTSETTPGKIFVSDSPDGPFEFLGKIKWDANGFSPGLAAYKNGKGNMSNVMIIPRHDGRYMIVARSTAIMISEDGILGPYKIVSDRVYKDDPRLPQTRMEDPTAWYSGGMYHMLVNHWPGRTTYHFSSLDGIKDWKYRGIAYRKDKSLFRYTDGTVNDWPMVQRPTAFVNDGHITHFNFSVIDVTKGEDRGNDRHGSKIIVIPFDGERFDRDMQALVRAEDEQ